MHNDTLGKDIFMFAVRMNYGYECFDPNRMHLSAWKSSGAILSLTLPSYFWMSAENCGIFLSIPQIHVFFCGCFVGHSFSLEGRFPI